MDIGKPITKNFRKLLTQGFNDTEFNAFCLDNFDEVYTTFGSTDKSPKIQQLLDYCQKNEAFDKLDECLQEEAPPAQYQKFAPYFEDAETGGENEEVEALLREFDFKQVKKDFRELVKSQNGGFVVIHGQKRFGHQWVSSILVQLLRGLNPRFNKKSLPVMMPAKVSYENFKDAIVARLPKDKTTIDIALGENSNNIILTKDLSKDDFMQLVFSEGFFAFPALLEKHKQWVLCFIDDALQEDSLPEGINHLHILPKLHVTAEYVNAWFDDFESNHAKLCRHLDSDVLEDAAKESNSPRDVLIELIGQLGVNINIDQWTS